MHYQTIATEGGLLPSDILDMISAPNTTLTGQAPKDFDVDGRSSLGDRIAAAWQAARGHWMLFKTYTNGLRPDEAGTSVTRQRWVLPLLDVLGYQPESNKAYTVAGRSYAISHRIGPEEDAPPLHIEGLRTDLDHRPKSGRPRMSPHALVQEYLNSTEQLWGLVTNGDRLRLLRDSSRFTMPVYVEFNLRAMFEGELFSEFALLYRLLHRSRMPQPGQDAAACLLEQYHRLAVERGGRVRDGLRGGVEQALRTLGGGLLAHPTNERLREQVRSGALPDSEYYRQLLRLVYRLLFLMVAEERLLITAAPDDDATDTLIVGRMLRADAPQRIYREHYSLARLRTLAEKRGAGRGTYDDLWQSLQITFRIFSGDDERSPAALGLAPLDGDLFGPKAIPALEGQRLANAHLLAALRALSRYYDEDSRMERRVNYAALDVEELGSVYESLLDYRPLLSAGGELPELDGMGQPSRYFQFVPGTERKTTGSYYTRPELVKELIRSALIPVLDERLREAAQAHRGDATAIRNAQEQAILTMRVCDPACGSGHFLLEAARRLGRELARVRSGEDQPSPQQFRLAVRDVVQHCIYGVDYNPLAVDLCKLALWLEGHSAGMPLSFLDNHIKHGNSLVGATNELVRQGIPDDAYKAVTGDDKKTATDLRKRNKREREAYLRGMIQHGMFDAPAQDSMADLARQAQAVDAMATGTVAEVRAKAQRYQELYDSDIASRERVRFDLWTSAFFLPLTPENAATVPTTDAIDAFKRHIPIEPTVKAARHVAREAHFFHWELEFPEVFVGGAGGFDVVLGNPPWERIKLQEQEHWVDVAEVRDAANKAARERVIQAWRDGTPAQQARVAMFDAAKYRAEAESRFVRASGRFPLTAVGDVNTYALFAEHAQNVLSDTGRTGVIVPTGIATDDTTKAFFGDISQKGQLVSLFDFENRENIFQGVGHGRFKFSLVTLGKSNHPTEFIFFATNTKHLDDKYRRFFLTSDEIALINPNTRTAPIFRTQADAELTKKIYLRVPVLINEKTDKNPWNLRFMTMFHMSNDSGRFLNAPNKELVRLYEAKMIWHFTHRFGDYADYPEGAETTALPTIPPERLANPQYEITTRYWVASNDVNTRLAERTWKRNWLLGFRDITNATNERTAIFSLFPRVAVSNKIPLIFPQEPIIALVACFLACVNSLSFDFVVRQKMGGVTLNLFILYQLPVLPPEAFSAEDIAYIAPRVAELVYTAWDMQPFAADLWAEAGEPLRAELLRRSAECNHGADPALFAPRGGLPLPPFRWDEERRALARAQLDARIARLYGLTRDELRYILDPKEVHGEDFPGETFRVLKEKEQKLYGEYRTRRLVLEAWDHEHNTPQRH